MGTNYGDKAAEFRKRLKVNVKTNPQVRKNAVSNNNNSHAPQQRERIRGEDIGQSR